MRVFVSGTDTNIGKTVVSSWLCLKTGYSYFKPIQTGSQEGSDTKTVSQLSNAPFYPEIYSFSNPLSPHLCAKQENVDIDLSRFLLPSHSHLIVEGCGGVMVPINDDYLFIDLLKAWSIPTILVARSGLGTINHTLLTTEALQERGIKVLGIILNGPLNPENSQAIEFYSGVPVIAQIPFIEKLDRSSLNSLPLTNHLKNIFHFDSSMVTQRIKEMLQD